MSNLVQCRNDYHRYFGWNPAWIEDIAFQLHQEPTGGVRKVRLGLIAGREQVEMSLGPREMKACR